MSSALVMALVAGMGLPRAIPSVAASRAVAYASYGRLPLHFEAGDHLGSSSGTFVARPPGYTVLLGPGSAVLRPSRARDPLRLRLLGANPRSAATTSDELPGKVHYLIGSDPRHWRTNVPTYARVGYRDIYPGVDIVYYGQQGQLEYDIVVAPGADPGTIAFQVEGAGTVAIDPAGDLVLRAGRGDVRLKRPHLYQEIAGRRQSVGGGYVVSAGNRVGFRTGRYDRTRPLVIDPVLAYSTYLGGTANDQGLGIDVDSAGNTYITGDTERFDEVCFIRPGDPACELPVNFPVVSALQPAHAGFKDAFVTKLNASGTAVLYSTFIGGSGFDQGNGIAVDAAGNAYVAGVANSFDFPTTPGSLQPGPGGTAFVLKLNPTGSALLYSTYLGGGGNLGDAARGIAVDGAGNAYVTGETGSPDFPTVNAAQPASAGGYDAFVVKVNAAGSAALYSTSSGAAAKSVTTVRASPWTVAAAPT